MSEQSVSDASTAPSRDRGDAGSENAATISSDAQSNAPSRASSGPDHDDALVGKANAFLRGNARWHVVLTGIASTLTWASGHVELAWSLALGALLMYANLTMATRTLLRAFRTTTNVPQSPAAALAWATRWPLLALALVGILWYMPARPEGIALGIALSLLSSVLTALGLPDADPHHG